MVPFVCSLNVGLLILLQLQSVLSLVMYRTRMIESTEEGWVDQVISFMDKFYLKETRTAVRKEALNYLGSVVAENSLSQEVGGVRAFPPSNSLMCFCLLHSLS